MHEVPPDGLPRETARARGAIAIAEVRAGSLRGAALFNLLETLSPSDREAWLDGLLGIDGLPDDQPNLPRGAVPYIPASVDEIVTVVREAPLTANGHFVDLGSGLGRAVVLAHLLTEARASGIELQRHLVEASRASATALQLPLEFACCDAREADERAFDASLFFLYAPFHGPMLDVVLERIRESARMRDVVVATVTIGRLERTWLRPRDTSNVAVTLYDVVPA